MARATAAHLADGQAAENLAGDHLLRQGLNVLARNVRTPYGEIDLICEHAGTLVFVEVRFRRDSAHGTPAETVGTHKRRKLRASAEHYLQAHRLGSKKAARFDIVAIHGPLAQARVEWLQNAF
jgi:putative endonuclease